MSDLAVWENWREYLNVVSWLVPDIYRHAKAKMLGIVLLTVIGVSARAATIGSVLLFVDARTTRDPLVFAGVTLPTEASAPIFLLWGCIALAFAALTITASYRVNVVTLDLAQSYMENAMRRVLQHQAAGRPFSLPEDFESRAAQPVALMLRGDTLRLVRVVVQTLGILIPFVTLLGSVAVLMLTNWMLTLFLIPAAAAYSYVFGMLNRGVLRDAQKRQFARQRMSRDVKDILGTLDRTRYPAGGEPHWLDSYPHPSWLQEVVSAFRNITLARRRVTYLSDAFRGVTLLIVLMVFGNLVADQATSWAVLLTYLVALGYATRSMDAVSGSVTFANRYIPQLRRYVLFMQMNPEVEPLDRDFGRSGVFRFEALEPRLAGSRSNLETRRGQVVWCVIRGRLRTSMLGEMCFALAGADPAEALHVESETFFLGKVARLPERPVRAYLPHSECADAGIQKRIDDFFDAVGVRSEFDSEIGDLDTVLTHELDEKLSPALRYALRLLPGMLAKPHLFVLSFDALEELGDVCRDRVLSTLADRVVMLVPGDPRAAPIPGIAGVVVIDGEKICGVGDGGWRPNLEWAELEGDSESSAFEWVESKDVDGLEDLDDED